MCLTIGCPSCHCCGGEDRDPCCAVPQLADPQAQQVLNDRGPYLGMFFGCTVLAIILYLAGYDLTKAIYEEIYDSSSCSEDSCWANNSVYRVSLALTFYFSGAFVIASIRALSDVAASFKLPFIVKFIPLLGFLVLTFCLEIDVLDEYATACLYFSGLFLLLQVLVFLDFAHNWNESWRDRGNFAGLIAFSLFLFAVAITCWVLFYVYLNSGGCSIVSFFISFTLVLSVGVTLLSISEFSENGALLPSAIVVVYCTYLLYSSLMANNDSGCSSVDSSSVWVSIIGFVLSSVAIIYASWNLSNSYNAFGISHSKQEKDQVKYDAEAPSAPSPVRVDGAVEVGTQFVPSAPSEDEEKSVSGKSTGQLAAPPAAPVLFIPNPKAWMFFHFVMVLASMYMGVVIAGWSTYLYDDDSTGGSTGEWIIIITQWLTFLLYIWTLIAPKLFPDRDFSGIA
eukprot:TRINITY_DN14114_c0_g1_i1.p1 TRINITY_DN14114_c0_g1~~TRINITY_DN14114_c0_g1_i1.p1  ORF type:complete len:452 (-),score=115.01 TRINITY_DN14114_c0_g1_i1:81-1436(-)